MNNKKPEFDLVAMLALELNTICENYGGGFNLEFIQGSTIFYATLYMYMFESHLTITIDETKANKHTVDSLMHNVKKWINLQYQSILEEIK